MAANPAETYESYIVPSLFAPWAETLVRLAEPVPGEQMLDVACGTGIVARRASPLLAPTGAAHGVDPNPNMLSVAREACEREGLQVQFADGRAEELPYPDNSFDVVTCQQGAQFFTDRPKGFAEMKRVLKDGGRAVISTWQPLERHDFFSALHESMQEQLGSAAAAAPFTLGEAAELSALMQDAGFEGVEVEQASLTAVYPGPERFLDETLEALMAVVASMLEIDTSTREAGVASIKTDLREQLERHTRGDEILLPWHNNIASGIA